MKLEDIIEGLNRSIEAKRENKYKDAKGHLIVQRIITAHPTFKAYKICETILWFVSGKHKYRVITLKDTAKILEGKEEKWLKQFDIEFCELIFNWIGSNFYEQVVKGEYNGYTNE